MGTELRSARGGADCAACDLIVSWLRFPYGVLTKIYVFIFGRPGMQLANDAILQLALKGRGYKNCCDPKVSGEEIFITRISATDPKLCIDIGANVGKYSKALLTRTKADVIAFEPMPKAFSLLSDLALDYPTRFRAVNVGVGSRKAEMDIHYGDEDSEFATFSPEANNVDYVRERNVNVMTLPVIPLDSYYEENIKGKYDFLDLLKIDVEGLEYDVLLGARQIIADLRPKFIQIEYNWHHLFRSQTLESFKYLLGGYNSYQLLPYGNGIVYRDLSKPESNIFHYSNFIFVREDISLEDF
jgi:FkbM family methyltransferase